MHETPEMEVVREMYDASNRGDFDRTQNYFHPDVELIVSGDYPDAGVYRGRRGLMRWFANFYLGSWTGVARMANAWRGRLSTIQDARPEVKEYRELEDERVLVVTRRSGRGKTSGLEIGRMQTKGAALFHVRGGEVTKLVVYWDRDRALADLGLAPEAEAP
jgi:ketosteroid isomerase-like protein